MCNQRQVDKSSGVVASSSSSSASAMTMSARRRPSRSMNASAINAKNVLQHQTNQDKAPVPLQDSHQAANAQREVPKGPRRRRASHELLRSHHFLYKSITGDVSQVCEGLTRADDLVERMMARRHSDGSFYLNFHLDGAGARGVVEVDAFDQGDGGVLCKDELRERLEKRHNQHRARKAVNSASGGKLHRAYKKSYSDEHAEAVVSARRRGGVGAPSDANAAAKAKTVSDKIKSRREGISSKTKSAAVPPMLGGNKAVSSRRGSTGSMMSSSPWGVVIDINPKSGTTLRPPGRTGGEVVQGKPSSRQSSQQQQQSGRQERRPSSGRLTSAVQVQERSQTSRELRSFNRQTQSYSRWDNSSKEEEGSRHNEAHKPVPTLQNQLLKRWYAPTSAVKKQSTQDGSSDSGKQQMKIEFKPKPNPSSRQSASTADDKIVKSTDEALKPNDKISRQGALDSGCPNSTARSARRGSASSHESARRESVGALGSSSHHSASGSSRCGSSLGSSLGSSDHRSAGTRPRRRVSVDSLDSTSHSRASSASSKVVPELGSQQSSNDALGSTSHGSRSGSIDTLDLLDDDITALMSGSTRCIEESSHENHQSDFTQSEPFLLLTAGANAPSDSDNQELEASDKKALGIQRRRQSEPDLSLLSSAQQATSTNGAPQDRRSSLGGNSTSNANNNKVTMRKKFQPRHREQVNVRGIVKPSKYGNNQKQGDSKQAALMTKLGSEGSCTASTAITSSFSSESTSASQEDFTPAQIQPRRSSITSTASNSSARSVQPSRRALEGSFTQMQAIEIMKRVTNADDAHEDPDDQTNILSRIASNIVSTKTKDGSGAKRRDKPVRLSDSLGSTHSLETENSLHSLSLDDFEATLTSANGESCNDRSQSWVANGVEFSESMEVYLFEK